MSTDLMSTVVSQVLISFTITFALTKYRFLVPEISKESEMTEPKGPIFRRKTFLKSSWRSSKLRLTTVLRLTRTVMSSIVGEPRYSNVGGEVPVEIRLEHDRTIAIRVSTSFTRCGWVQKCLNSSTKMTLFDSAPANTPQRRLPLRRV